MRANAWLMQSTNGADNTVGKKKKPVSLFMSDHVLLRALTQRRASYISVYGIEINR